jgi:hypothetical protein
MPENYLEHERCPDCGDMIPVGIPHTMRECAIARERAVREAQITADLEMAERAFARETTWSGNPSDLSDAERETFRRAWTEGIRRNFMVD